MSNHNNGGPNDDDDDIMNNDDDGGDTPVSDLEDDFDDILESGDNDDDDVGFDDFNENAASENTLADLWRNNPLFKIGAIIAGAALVFGVIILLTSGGEDPDVSYVPTGSDITAPPGTTEATPAFREAVVEANQAEVERAIREGESALPVPIDTPVGRLELPDEGGDAQEDPLERWRRLQQERLERDLEQRELLNQQEQQNLASLQPQAPTDYTQDIQALSGVMSQQMQSILENRSQTRVSYLAITAPGYFEREELRKAQQAAEIANAKVQAVNAANSLGQGQGGYTINEDGTVTQQGGQNGEQVQTTLLPAGEIVYAQLITEANSDAPGPVLAELVSGPLKGSRILGAFEVQNDLLTLNFNTVVVKDKSLAIEAVAVDPGTTLPAMATEVDHRYLRKVLLPAAAAFVEGMASAIAESGRTSITVTGETVSSSTGEASNDQEVATGIAEAGEEIGEILDEEADKTQTLVRIESGTPMGILFLQPVVE